MIVGIGILMAAKAVKEKRGKNYEIALESIQLAVIIFRVLICLGVAYLITALPVIDITINRTILIGLIICLIVSQFLMGFMGCTGIVKLNGFVGGLCRIALSMIMMFTYEIIVNAFATWSLETWCEWLFVFAVGEITCGFLKKLARRDIAVGLDSAP